MTAAAQPLAEQAFAHGKVILGGEHAVVYGCSALAASIPNALELRCSPLDDAAMLELEVPHWKLHRTIPARPELDEDRLTQAIRSLFEQAQVQPWGRRIQGRTELPAGSGLGSSAALCVALAKLALGPGADKDQLFDLSMIGESVFHGEASGIDSQLALNGGLVRFTRGQKPETLHLAHPLKLWIISSDTPRQSADQVSKVKSRMFRFPKLAAPTWALFDAQVQHMQHSILSNHLKDLGEMMQMQHELLSTLGVSTPRLDALCHCAHQAGALGAKLTGAGGGGCVLVLPPPEPHEFSCALQDAMQKDMNAVFPHFPLEIPAS